jgi:hypothetical protein
VTEHDCLEDFDLPEPVATKNSKLILLGKNRTFL